MGPMSRTFGMWVFVAGRTTKSSLTPSRRIASSFPAMSISRTPFGSHRVPTGFPRGDLRAQIANHWEPASRADRAAAAIAEALTCAAISALVIVTASRVRVLMPS